MLNNCRDGQAAIHMFNKTTICALPRGGSDFLVIHSDQDGRQGLHGNANHRASCRLGMALRYELFDLIVETSEIL